MLVATGCGGRTDQEEDEGADPSDPPAATPEDGQGDGEDEPEDPTGILLPGCEKGFDASVERDRSCNWLAEGYCYEDKLEACACVCPRDSSVTSHCASGFPVEDGKVEVYCY